ncbi:hypothetical protein BFP72_15680 [Reichenbachiella sp. 5M10]|uniref:TVP38/TMEM64 family protein n=1 Tax=Reichenbachiella sp. 5M10 TaxID=1889772 RepID=UPI000C153C8B|nr:VTT domain-containing protein [Reichenbachiella sp. 5M10]PIB36738.1 hypothetical protein BFP72_15680 [Reichenbachiella sp. 5M10]
MTFDRLGQQRFITLFRQNKSIGILMLWMAIVPLSASVLSAYFLVGREEAMSEWTMVAWLLLYGLTAVTMAMAITPTTYVALLSGYFFGWESLVAVVVAYQCASVLGYGLAKLLNEGFVSNLVKVYPKAKGYMDNVSQKQWATTVLSRLSPALPFALMNVVLSSSGIRFVPFFFGGLFGMLPRTVLFVWVGSKAHELQDALYQDQGVLWSLLISLVVLYAIYRLLRPASP